MPPTTMAERKELVRQIIQRVMVAGEGPSERLQGTMEWVGVGPRLASSPALLAVSST